MTYPTQDDPRYLLDRYQIELNRRIDALREGRILDTASIPGLCHAIASQAATVELALAEMTDERRVA